MAAPDAPDGFSASPTVLRSRSPSKSPSKRGIISPQVHLARPTTPLRKPNGRAGLPSPEKRSADDLDRSARKRSSQAYARLMMEEEEDEDEFLKQEELELAEAIIRESKRLAEEQSLELTAQPTPQLAAPKKKRGRPRKDQAATDLSAATHTTASAATHPATLDVDLPPKKKRGRPRKQPLETEGAENVSHVDSASAETTQVKEESEAPEVPVKRKRGRPRKEDAAKFPKVVEVPLVARRSERRVVSERKERERQEQQRRLEEELARTLEEESRGLTLEAPSDDDSGSDMDAVLSEEEEVKPKRRGRPPSTTPVKRKPKEPTSVARLKSSSPFKEDVERRTKKGRPSKQENVTKQVMSIFQMDDIELFTDRSGGSPEKTPSSSPSKGNGHFTINFDNKGDSTYHGVPSISGIAEPKTTSENIDRSGLTKFTPLPVPEVDENGDIKDPEYVDKHLPGVKPHLESSGRLIDERSFFLEGSEGYFEQHSLRFRPSATSLSANAPELGYEELIPMIELSKFVHGRARKELDELHKKLYHQWCFELSQGYSLLFYGVGSKVNLITNFVTDYLLGWYQDTIQDNEEHPAVMVINGYNPETKLKTMIHEIVSNVVTAEEKRNSDLRMPKHVSEAFPFLIKHLKRSITKSANSEVHKAKLILIVHNIDGDAFRDERSQNYLSELAALPNVWLLTSSDNINLSLLWDLSRFKNFNFLWHDATTFEPYRVEGSFKQALSMGQSKKFVGTKGVKYVLKSLTTNAKNLYKILLEMQLEKLREHSASQAGRTGLRGSVKLSIELRALYDKCLNAYIASNEMNLKTMLGEYVEHKMCSLTKNSGGLEVVFVPFSFDEMEKLLAAEFT